MRRNTALSLRFSLLVYLVYTPVGEATLALSFSHLLRFFASDTPSGNLALSLRFSLLYKNERPLRKRVVEVFLFPVFDDEFFK